MTEAPPNNRVGRLPDNVAYFGRALRAAGMPVGPGDVVDAVEALASAGVGARADFYWVLHAVFVRRHEHSILFEQAFRAFWRRRDLAGTLLAEASRIAPTEQGDAEPPKAGETRIAQALRPKQAPLPRPEPDEKITARLTGSDRERLKTRDFAQMTADEVATATRLIASLDLTSEARRTRRLVPARRAGRVDFRRSLRGSLRNGGSSIELAFRRPGTRPPPVVALIDISGSMTEYSRLFLHFMHALTARRQRVHSFVFATRLTNVTRELLHRDPDDALARAAARVVDWEGGTRIAEALRSFNQDWSRRVLGGGATLLLFTDGLERDVGADLVFQMDRLARSCRRLVWLNPLLRFDAFEARASGIRAMLPHVDDFRPIHSLGSMQELVDALRAGMMPASPSSRGDVKRRPE